MLCQDCANQLRALFNAQLSAVQRHIVRLNLPPFLAGVEAIIGASALILILQPLLRSLGPLAVLFHNALCPEGHICMNEDLQNIGTVLQDKVRTPADNDAGALLCRIRNDTESAREYPRWWGRCCGLSAVRPESRRGYTPLLWQPKIR